MIIELLLDVLYGVFYTLTLPINIPGMPDGVRDILQTTLQYIGTGISVLNNYFDLNYLITLFGIIISVDVGILIYKIVMWVIRKIPMLGIE